jgi:methylated-DNA-protein-cysteine methyltransferase related protein
MTDFQQAIIKAVGYVPPGRVVSYGQIAAYIGSPRAARQVGWAMGSIGDMPDFPWWRVVNKNGVITINNQYVTPEMQRRLLVEEAVEVDEELRIDMKRFGFDLLGDAPVADETSKQQVRLVDERFFDKS